jgi:hypothetical protein
MDGGKFETGIQIEFIGKEKTEASKIPSVLEISDEEYERLILSLNSKQKQYAFDVQDCLENHIKIREFLYGGAGASCNKTILKNRN